MKVIFNSLFLVSVCLVACDSPDPGFGGRGSISGRVFVDDPLLSEKYPAKSTITLSSNSENANSILTITSDSLGYFLFPNLTKGNFRINASFIKQLDSNSQLEFDTTFDITLKNNRDEKKIDSLLLTINQTGTLLVEIVDTDANFQPNFSFCLYANKSASDINSGCKGSIYQSRTGYSGVGAVSNLIDKAKYYLKAYDSLGSVVLSGKGEVVIESTPTIKRIIVN